MVELELTVGGGIDLLRQGGDLYGEAVLHFLQRTLVVGRRDERHRETLGAEAAGAAHAMQVLVRVRGQGEVVVDHDVDALDVDTTAKEIG